MYGQVGEWIRRGKDCFSEKKGRILMPRGWFVNHCTNKWQTAAFRLRGAALL